MKLMFIIQDRGVLILCEDANGVQSLDGPISPELAAWIVAANAALENHGWPYRECERVAVEYGPALTDEVEIEI